MLWVRNGILGCKVLVFFFFGANVFFLVREVVLRGRKCHAGGKMVIRWETLSYVGEKTVIL